MSTVSVNAAFDFFLYFTRCILQPELDADHVNRAIQVSLLNHPLQGAALFNLSSKFFLGGRCVGLTSLPPACADCLEIWEPQPAGTLRACPGL